MEFPPDQYWYCTVIITVLAMAMLCGTFLLVAMTFDRFYSIVRPHKAASFNTIRRTKIIISLVIVSSIVFNIPHLFTSDHQGCNVHPTEKPTEMCMAKCSIGFHAQLNLSYHLFHY